MSGTRTAFRCVFAGCDGMGVKMTWIRRPDGDAIARRFVNDRVMTFAHLELWRLCIPYVPMRTGTLMESVEITPQYLRYAVPYALRCYTGVNMHFRTDRHALATAQWDQVAMATQKDKLTRAVAAFMKKQAQ